MRWLGTLNIVADISICLSTLIRCGWAYGCALTLLPILLGSYFAVLCHLWSQHDVIMSWLRLTATSNWFPHPYYTYTKCLSTLICCPLAYSSSLKQLYPSYLAQILGFWVTCGVKMMSLRHGWGWQLPQTTSHILNTHMQSVWPQWYAVHWHPVAAIHSFTHINTLRFLGSGSLVWSWIDGIMSCWGWQPPQTASCIHFRQYKVFEHIDMLFIGIGLQHNTVLPTVIGSDLGFLGHLLELRRWCYNVMVEADSHLKLLNLSKLDITKCLSLSTLICCT